MARALNEYCAASTQLAYVKKQYIIVPALVRIPMSLNAKPLAGLKVIELGTLIAGPFASRICAEFGAEVIKVESPGRRRPAAQMAQAV